MKTVNHGSTVTFILKFFFVIHSRHSSNPIIISPFVPHFMWLVHIPHVPHSLCPHWSSRVVAIRPYGPQSLYQLVSILPNFFSFYHFPNVYTFPSPRSPVFGFHKDISMSLYSLDTSSSLFFPTRYVHTHEMSDIWKCFCFKKIS